MNLASKLIPTIMQLKRERSAAAQRLSPDKRLIGIWPDFLAAASKAANFRSKRDSEGGAPECSTQLSAAATPHVGQGTENTCLGVSSFLFHSDRVLPHGSQSIRLMMGFSAIEGVKGQLQPIRSSHFVEDPKQIVTDGMLTQFQFLGNVAVSHAFGYQVHNAFFPLREQSRCSHNVWFCRWSRTQRFDHEAQFLTARPHLSFVHRVDALAQQLRRLIPREYATGSCSECVHDHRRFVRIEYHDDAGLRVRSHNLSRHTETSPVFVFKTSTDDCNVGFVLFESFANSNRIRRVADHPSSVPAPSHGRRYQLTAQLTAVSDEDFHRADACWGLVAISANSLPELRSSRYGDCAVRANGVNIAIYLNFD
jgi:hypothetical protein